MKLSDWAKKQGISYLTAYRWWKDGKLPANSYQSDSGTIIVQDDSEILEQTMSYSPQLNNDAMSLFLKKTVEFSKNNSSVEDFAAYVLSNFSIKINNGQDSPKYSKNKPKSEEIQKHFKKFIPAKGEKPKPNMFVAGEEMLENLVNQSDDLTTQVLIDEIQKYTDAPTEVPEFNDLIKDLNSTISSPSSPGIADSVTPYGDNTIGGIINRNIDFSPQQINHNISGSNSFDSNFSYASNSLKLNDSSEFGSSSYYVSPPAHSSFNFNLTQKKLEESVKLFETVEKPKRGRPRKK